MVSTTRDGAAVLGEFDDMMTRDEECFDVCVCVWSGAESVWGGAESVWGGVGNVWSRGRASFADVWSNKWTVSTYIVLSFCPSTGSWLGVRAHRHATILRSAVASGRDLCGPGS